jgi:hypothetical protein
LDTSKRKLRFLPELPAQNILSKWTFIEYARQQQNQALENSAKSR